MKIIPRGLCHKCRNATFAVAEGITDPVIHCAAIGESTTFNIGQRVITECSAFSDKGIPTVYTYVDQAWILDQEAVGKGKKAFWSPAELRAGGLKVSVHSSRPTVHNKRGEEAMPSAQPIDEE